MSEFITTIKTRYTNTPVITEKKTFESPYSSKNKRIAISGDNRNTGKKFTSRLIK